MITLKLDGDAGLVLARREPRAHRRGRGDGRAGPRAEQARGLLERQGPQSPAAIASMFQVGDQPVAKELAIGDGFMRVSIERPGWDWSAILLNPWEEPFRPDDPVQSIAIDYPERSSWTSGTDSWVIYWFVVSMVAALCFRRRAEGQRLNGDRLAKGERRTWRTRSSSSPACRAPARRS